MLSIIMLKLIFIFALIKSSHLWPDHDTSTLKLLQILHRHGDRTPYKFPVKDPYANDTERYWPAGIGQLTSKGKYRMFKLGQFFRKNYHDFLENNPRKVYVRSSIEHRCIESAASLLAGAFPPDTKWDWSSPNSSLEKVSLGNIWQPFPIETFMPENRDALLVVEVNCKTVNEEHHKLQNSSKINEFLLPRRQFLQNLSKIVDQKIETLDEVDVFYDALLVEADQHNYWWPIWSKKEQKEIMEQLKVMADFNYETNWSIPIIQKLRSGLLIFEIYKNIENYIDGNSTNKFYHYSAHDTTVVSMLSLLDSFDNQLVPYGSTIIFELHKTDDYFVKIYYLNDTYKELPNLLKIGICDKQERCPLDKFHERIKTFYVRNYDEECQNKQNSNDSSSQFIHSKSSVLLLFCVILYLINVKYQ